MKIIETFTQGKNNIEEFNEDGLYIGEHYLAVIDGVTNKSENEIWFPTPGVFVKNLIKKALSSASPTCTSIEMYRYLNQAILSKYGKNFSYFKNHSIDRLQVNLIVYSRHFSEVWFFGDCHCQINDKYHGGKKKIDVLLGELRSFVLQKPNPFEGKKSDTSTEVDYGRDAILPFLKMQSDYANTDSEYGFLVLDGIGFCPEKIKVVPVESPANIILASDGYPVLFGTLAESEDYLENLKREDPQLISQYKSTKGFIEKNSSFDDRSYLKFEI